MLRSSMLNDLSIKIKELVINSPAEDLNKNLNALIEGAFTKIGLVSREDLDTQAAVLHKTRAKLHALEQKITELEAQLRKSNTID